MNEFTIPATLVIALICAVLLVAWLTRRERAQVARLRKEQKEAEAAMQARTLAVRTAECSGCVDTKRRTDPAERWARKLPTAPLRPSYRAPAPAPASSSTDLITPTVLAMAAWRDDTPASAAAPAFVSGGGGDYSGGGASGSWSDSSSSSSATRAAARATAVLPPAVQIERQRCSTKSTRT